MLVEKNVPLQPYNTFHIVAKAISLVRVTQVTDLLEVLAEPQWQEPSIIALSLSNWVAHRMRNIAILLAATKKRKREWSGEKCE